MGAALVMEALVVAVLVGVATGEATVAVVRGGVAKVETVVKEVPMAH